MRALLRLMARLYPSAWRARYGDEFAALLDDARPRWWDVFDILRGAISVRLSAGGLGKLVAAFGIAGALAGLAATFVIPRSYTSTGALRMKSPVIARSGAHAVNSAAMAALSRKSLADLIQREDLYTSLRTKEPLEKVIVRMQRDVLIAPSSSDSFRVAFAYGDPRKAQRVTQIVMDAMVAAADTGGPLGLTVGNPPSLPAVPNGPNRLVVVGAGIGFGVFLGLLIHLFYIRAAIVRTAISLGVVGGLLGAATSMALPRQFVSMAVIRAWVGPESATAAAVQQRIENSITRKVLVDIIRKQASLYRRERESQPFEDVVALFRRNIRFTQPGPGLIQVSFSNEDPAIAFETTPMLVAALMVPPAPAPHPEVEISLEVVDPVRIPMTPRSPNPGMVTGLGVGLGLVVGAGLGRWRQARGNAPQLRRA